jgi:hypothetical protein
VTREKVVERLVAWIWERQALVGPLPGDDGARYQVVFRGRPWGDRGPDFQGAVLARQDGVLLRGDVEVHVRASDWRRHGHGRDPAYNQTVCQVVLWDDERRPTRRQDGATVPTLELVKHLAASLAELERRQLAEEGVRPSEPSCIPSPAELGELLERAGLERFLAKSAQLEGDLAGLPPDEVLYRASLRAMGYTANTGGFEQLSSLLSLAQIRDAAGEPATVQALLFGVAGLLPSQRGATAEAGLPHDLERIWTALSATLPAPLPRGAWRWWRVRPENLPPRRLAGFGQIVSSWLRVDPVERLLDDLADAERLSRPAHLAEAWRVRANDPFWTGHFDFGRATPSGRPWLIGSGRAGEVVVNVSLPFLHALGQARGDGDLSGRALALYRRYPTTAQNRVTREMALQLGGPDGARHARTACRQQGLIHLYKHWCDLHDCGHCPALRSAGRRSPLGPGVTDGSTGAGFRVMESIGAESSG